MKMLFKTNVVSAPLIKTSFSVILLTSLLVGCSNYEPRINPGKLDVSENVNTYSAKVVNIVQLSDKEAPAGKVIWSGIGGALIGAALTDGKSDDTQEAVTELGGVLGAGIAHHKYGKTVYRLTLLLNGADKKPPLKQVYVRGGLYQVGQLAKVTLDKKSGRVTSLLASS